MESNFHSPFSPCLGGNFGIRISQFGPRTAPHLGASGAKFDFPNPKFEIAMREAQQRRQKAWLDLEAMIVATHNSPTDMTPEQIEAEIGAARAEVRAKRIGSGRRH